MDVLQDVWCFGKKELKRQQVPALQSCQFTTRCIYRQRSRENLPNGLCGLDGGCGLAVTSKPVSILAFCNDIELCQLTPPCRSYWAQEVIVVFLKLFIIKYLFSRWIQEWGASCSPHLCDIFLNLCNLLLSIWYLQLLSAVRYKILLWVFQNQNIVQWEACKLSAVLECSFP